MKFRRNLQKMLIEYLLVFLFFLLAGSKQTYLKQRIGRRIEKYDIKTNFAEQQLSRETSICFFQHGKRLNKKLQRRN